MSREFDELLSAYLDGEVTPEERAAVERRLEQSPALRETLDELSEVGDLIRSLPRARAPIDLPERVVAAIAPAPLASTAHRKRNRLFGAWPLMTAGTVLAAGVAIVVLMPLQQKNAEDRIALNETHFGTEAATAGGARGRGLVEAEDGARRAALADGATATALNFDLNREKESLTESVRKLERPLRPGEVISKLRDNAGNTQVVRYVVVDTRRLGSTMNTILMSNNFNIVETETPAPRGGMAAAPLANNRYVYYVEGPPEQVENTFEQIERLPEFREWEDLGVLASDSDAIPVEFFADTPAKPESEFGRALAKDQADRPAAAPAPADRFADAQANTDFAAPALTTAAPVVPEVKGLVADPQPTKKNLGNEPLEAKVAERAKVLPPAAAQETAPRSEVDKLSVAPVPLAIAPQASPQAGYGYLGVSAQLDSNSPIVENVLKSRSAGNLNQGNANQRNAVLGNALQRQSTAPTQSNFFRARNMRLSEQQVGRKFNEAVDGEQLKKLEDAKGVVQLKQQAGGRAVADGVTDLDAAAVANPSNGPSQEDGLVRALIILEPQPPRPAAPAAEPAPKKAGD